MDIITTLFAASFIGIFVCGFFGSGKWASRCLIACFIVPLFSLFTSAAGLLAIASFVFIVCVILDNQKR